ncbi:haloacid dehalogenase, type II [Kwoniella heveanensis BCC8398]|uniref:Haloacid dehalogenase, type II n=1 Tax=Kwoniella heveanensis BCC8398 TaxID=1296120 RepID=A0A1B9GVJ6_9TREE|nr:haloacid dehalogenase, type II [Kwoniella heveanensis BCC8398]
MTLTVCFDALGTCFTLADIIQAVEEQYGRDLVGAGWGVKGFVNDWFHSCQRDYTYLSLISPPPPAIASILKTNLPLSLSAALNIPPPSPSSLEAITSLLASLPPAPTLRDTFKLLSESGNAKLVIVTNGAKETTEGYADKADVKQYVETVLSCDQIGLAKPHKEVYEAANKACDALEGGQGDERWFVAAHIWDLAAAKEAGFRTALVLSDPPSEVVQDDKENAQLQSLFELYGGRPDLVAPTLLELAQEILARSQIVSASNESLSKFDADLKPDAEDGPQLTGEEGEMPPDRATLLVI